ncbi:RNA-splicing ligase rtcb [Anaeramoeba flamelloides]|uniref:3'-phosphate/5'-hydroxy nucleic acid ligase n=1 Tax=Anaeramoeba flamelloides TaxID=1746091 RepID=A0AAV8A6Y2_9EUKA|nr:RNA-splicing ligase rtcb [Anaeramoeba flamelloides]
MSKRSLDSLENIDQEIETKLKKEKPKEQKIKREKEKEKEKEKENENENEKEKGAINKITVQGACSTAIVYTPEIDEYTEKQIQATVDHIAFKGSKIRIMPDVHAGAGSVIGFTATLTDKIIPNIVGVDIGCGVIAINLGKQEFTEERYQKIDKFIQKSIPAGFKIHPKEVPFEDMKKVLESIDPERDLEETIKQFKQLGEDIGMNCHQNDRKRRNKRTNIVMRSIGSLGGGNHFIELDKDDQEDVWLTVHTGSRNLGLRVALFHQKKAREIVGKMDGREYLEGKNAKMYYDHMKIAQFYAKFQRRMIAYRITKYFFNLELSEQETVESVHNYINFKDSVIRKGAISAKEGEKVVIPFNMAAGLIIGTGKGNPNWNNSAPHGAGRVMSRTKAKKTIPLKDFTKVMKKAGVWSSCVVKSVLDEAPQVYKNVEEIIKYLTPTVNIDRILKPIYNFKAK